MVFATVSRMLCLCLYLNDVLLLLQDHKMEMESEFERFGREGGDASNMSVAVTRAFGDVDERFGNYVYVPALVLSMQFFFSFGCSFTLVADVCIVVAKKSEALAQSLQVCAKIMGLSNNCALIL